MAKQKAGSPVLWAQWKHPLAQAFGFPHRAACSSLWQQGRSWEGSLWFRVFTLSTTVNFPCLNLMPFIESKYEPQANPPGYGWGGRWAGVRSRKWASSWGSLQWWGTRGDWSQCAGWVHPPGWLLLFLSPHLWWGDANGCGVRLVGIWRAEIYGLSRTIPGSGVATSRFKVPCLFFFKIKAFFFRLWK